MAEKLRSGKPPDGMGDRCESIEAQLRAGVPLWKIEARLDLDDNRLPPSSGKRPVVSPRRKAAGTGLAPAIHRGVSAVARLFFRDPDASRTA